MKFLEHKLPDGQGEVLEEKQWKLNSKTLATFLKGTLKI